MTDLLCLGEPLFEFSHIGGAEWREGVGGDVSNVAIAAARQGARVGMVSRLGQDSFGAAIRALWAAEGVDDSRVPADGAAPTGMYFIRHDAQGHHFEYRRRGSAACRVSVADMEGLEARILHLSGITLAISPASYIAALSAAQKVRAAGGRLSFDSNLRLALTSLAQAREAQSALFRIGCDIALPALEDARKLTGQTSPEAICAWYREAGASVVALTLGGDGAVVDDGATLHRIPAREAKLVDASGAGDCFDGCFLARLLAGDAPASAARYAVTAAALSVQGYGAVAAIPHAPQVEAALKT